MEQARIVDGVIARHKGIAPSAITWDTWSAAEWNDKAVQTVVARWAEDLYPKLIDGTATFPGVVKVNVSLKSTTQNGVMHKCVVRISYGHTTWDTTPTMVGMRVDVYKDIPNATHINLTQKSLDVGSGDEAIGVRRFTEDVQISDYSPTMWAKVFRSST